MSKLTLVFPIAAIAFLLLLFAEIVPLLSTMFLPFNLLKAGINAAITLLLYRPFLHVLRLCGFPVGDHLADKKTSVVLVAAVSAVLLAVCVGVVLYLNRG